jgi:hypothetical protein
MLSDKEKGKAPMNRRGANPLRENLKRPTLHSIIPAERK